MANIVDAMLIELGFDTKKLTEGQKQAESAIKKTSDTSKKADSEAIQRAKHLAEGFNKVKREILGIGMALLGAAGMKDFASKITESDRAVGRLATNLGMSTQRLSAWQKLAEKNGSSTEEMNNAFRTTLKLVQDIKTGNVNPEQFKALGLLGVNTSKFVSGATSVEEKMRMLQEGLSKTSAQNAQTFGQLFGLDENTINFLRATASNMDGLIAAQIKLNAVSGEDVALAEKRSQAWRQVSDRLQRFGIDVLNRITPLLEKALAWLDKMGQWAVENPNVSQPLFLVAGALAAIGAVSLTGILGGLGTLVSLAGSAAALLGAGGAGAWLGDKINGKLPESFKEKLGNTIGPLIDKLGGRTLMDAFGGSGGSGAASADTSTLAGKQAHLRDLEKKHGLPAGLLDSIWQQESGRGKNMKSAAGAEGHFQFMPATAKQYGVKDPYDFLQSSGGAARMFEDLKNKYGGNLEKMLGSYNWGSGNVDRKGLANAPLETQKYIPSVMAMMAKSGGGNTSTTEVKINNLVVNSAAKDAAGIAHDVHNKLQNYALASQATLALK